MSQVQYNGLELQIVKTNLFEMEAVYDSSGTDFIGIRFLLDVNFVLSPGATSYDETPAAGAGVLAARTLKNIRQMLLTPRKTLVYTVGPHEVLRSPHPLMQTDAATGPKPLKATVWRVDGARAMMGQYRIETFLPECPGSIVEATPILSHRWADQHVIDERFSTTRIVTGEIIFRRDVLDFQNEVADKYRTQLAHPIPDGFQRQRVEVAENPAGTVLQYRLVDAQQDVSLGENSPSVDIDATFTVMSNYGGDKADNKAANRVRFVGQAVGEPAANRFQMFRQLVQVALGRLRLGIGDKSDIILTAQATESLRKKAVQLDIVAFRQPDGDVAFPGLTAVPGADKDFLSRDCGALKSAELRNPAPPNSAGVRGSWNANLVAAALGSPCTEPTGPTVVTQSDDRGTNELGGPEITVAVSSEVAPGQLFNVIYSEETKGSGIFTDYSMDVVFATDECAFQVPIAGQTTSSSGKLKESDRGCVVMQYAHAVSRMVVDWTAEKIGAKPSAPKPRLNNPKVMLAKHKVQPAAFEVLADGSTVIHRISGRYEYLLHESVEAGVDVLDVALLPIYEDPGDARSFNPEDFVDGIIGGSGSEFRTS